MVREYQLQIIATIRYSRLQHYINLQNQIAMIVNIRKNTNYICVVILKSILYLTHIVSEKKPPESAAY